MRKASQTPRPDDCPADHDLSPLNSCCYTDFAMEPRLSQPLETNPDPQSIASDKGEFTAGEVESVRVSGGVGGIGIDDILRAAPGVIRAAQEILKRAQEATDPANLAPKKKKRSTRASGRKKPARKRTTKTRSRAKTKPRSSNRVARAKPKSRSGKAAPKPKSRPKRKPKAKSGARRPSRTTRSKAKRAA